MNPCRSSTAWPGGSRSQNTFFRNHQGDISPAAAGGAGVSEFLCSAAFCRRSSRSVTLHWRHVAQALTFEQLGDGVAEMQTWPSPLANVSEAAPLVHLRTNLSSVDKLLEAPSGTQVQRALVGFLERKGQAAHVRHSRLALSQLHTRPGVPFII